MDYVDYDIAEADISDCESAAVCPVGPATRPTRTGVRQAVVVVVEDGVWMSQELGTICEFLDIAVERVPGHRDLDTALGTHGPMAVVCELDGASLDGCHVMKTVANHDSSLPILIVTGDDPALMGAVDAVEDIWRLTEVTKLRSFPGIAGLVDFLFLAGRKGRCLRLVPV